MAALRCEVCGAGVTTLRRGRCSICYLRWAENRPVGLGATCIVCGERRRDHLKLVEFRRTWLSMCHSCSGRTFKLNPLPRTIAKLRQELVRERRTNSERRIGANDSRLSSRDRRRGDRRIPIIDVEMIEENDWIDAEDLIIEIIEACDPALKDQTRIIPRPPPNPRAG